jgi:hypothetical protein
LPPQPARHEPFSGFQVTNDRGAGQRIFLRDPPKFSALKKRTAGEGSTKFSALKIRRTGERSTKFFALNFQRVED